MRKWDVESLDNEMKVVLHILLLKVDENGCVEILARIPLN